MPIIPDFLEQAQVIFHQGGLVMTDEYDFAPDEKGLWTGTQIFYVRVETIATDLPARYTAHPVFSVMFVDKVRFSGSKAGWAKVTAEYVGLFFETEGTEEPAADDPNVRYVLGISLSEEPLETHSRYVAELTAIQIQTASEWAKNPPKTDGEPEEPDTAGWPALQIELYEFLSKGVTSYRSPRPTWTKSWVSSSRPASLNKVGKIDTPSGNPPTPGVGRTWLNTGLTSTQSGLVFENEESWELSGLGGWITEIYA